jgi:predicted NUDIX family NTP pyrophosphohydrolase
MPRISAGLLPYRTTTEHLEVLLVHPGGPFWARRDLGAWSIAKGEVAPGEEPLAAAFREFQEETGFALAGEVIALGSAKQPGGKLVCAWAIAADLDPAGIRSNQFEIEWPPRSGKRQQFPEVDRAAWFGLDEAGLRILPAQAALLEALRRQLQL